MSKSSSRTPMEMIDRYMQAVRFWLPGGQHAELMADLAEDLRSQVEAKQTELGRPLDDAEVSAILKRCGHPTLVASRLEPQRYLIGPTLFPIYLFVLKMVLLWILVPVFLLIVGPANLANAGGDWGIAVFRTFAALWSGAFVAAGVITLVFAVLERTQAQLGLADKWDPRSLPPVHKHERKASQVQVVCEALFGFVGLMWLLLLPHFPLLVFGPASAFLKAGPVAHTFYLPIVLLAVAGFLRPLITLVRPQWTWFPPSVQLLHTAFTLLIVNFMVDAAGRANIGDWHPFVVLADAARRSPQYLRVAAVVNVSLMLSLAGLWIGLCIAAVVQVWQLLRHFRQRTSSARQPASLHVH